MVLTNKNGVFAIHEGEFPNLAIYYGQPVHSGFRFAGAIGWTAFAVVYFWPRTFKFDVWRRLWRGE